MGPMRLSALPVFLLTGALVALSAGVSCSALRRERAAPLPPVATPSMAPTPVPTPTGPHVAPADRVTEAHPTSSGFTWVEQGTQQALHIWADGADTLLTQAERITDLHAAGDQLTWVADSRALQRYADGQVSTLWAPEGTQLRSIFPDGSGGVVVLGQVGGEPIAVWQVGQDGGVSALPAPPGDMVLVWADGAGVWGAERGDKPGLYRLDRAGGAWVRIADISYSYPIAHDGRIYWWERVGTRSNPYMYPDRQCSRAVDGSDRQEHRVLDRANGSLPPIDGVREVITADDRGVELVAQDGAVLGRFVLPNPGPEWWYVAVPEGVFWWTYSGVGVEPLSAP